MTGSGADWTVELLRGALDVATEGIVICEAAGKRPVVYVNAAFQQLCGYELEDLRGRNLSRLQGSERDQEPLGRLRAALGRGESCRLVLRNFRKDGSPFWNEMTLQPLRDPLGRLTHYAGFHREAADRPRSGERPASGMPSWIRDDRLTGLASRVFFEEGLQREWASAQRLGHEVTLLLFDIDHLGAYNDTYEKGGGDSCIRRVGHVIAGAFRRSSDLAARLEGGLFAVLVPGMSCDAAASYAKEVAQRVFDMHIHHPRATSRFVTVSVGVATLCPPRDGSPELLQDAAQRALEQAKTCGRNRVEKA
jgi:diguanylate cyclase (GGDEF)-like protein/PAS domain S-box-containing protein